MATGTKALPGNWETVEDLLKSLGGIAPFRVRMHPSPGTATEADLIAINDRRRGIHELVEGVLVEKASDLTGSILGLALACSLLDFIVPRNLGLVTGSTGLLQIKPGLFRSPSIAYVAWDRIPNRRVPTEPSPAFAPTLAVEVLFPDNTTAEMARKRREYFEAGVRIVWQVDPKKRTVAVYDAPERSTVLDATATLDGGDVLPGFVLPLAELFGELDRQGG